MHTTEHVSDLQTWQRIIAKSFVPMSVEPYLDAPKNSLFEAKITRVQAGFVGLSLIKSDPHIVDRSSDMVRRYPADYIKISFQIEGAAKLQQHGREIKIHPGQMSLYEARAPYRISFPTRSESIILQVPKHVLSLSDLQISDQAATLFSPAPGLRELLEAQFNFLKRKHAELLFTAQAITSMLNASLASHLPESVVTSDPELLERIKSYALTHLSDPALTQLDAAHANFVSPRSLQRAFAQHGLSFAKWLREERLKRAVQYLLNSEAPISKIAIDCGFSTPQLFSKVFKTYYGCTATEWRTKNKNAKTGVENQVAGVNL